MAIRLAIGGVLGAIILFMCGALAYMVLPHHYATINTLPDEDGFRAFVDSQQLNSGVYFYPFFNMQKEHTKEQKQAWENKHKAGPVGMLVHNNGSDSMDPIMFARGFVLNLLTSFLVAGMCIVALPNVRSYKGRVFYVAGFGLFTCLFTHLMFWNWMSFPIWYVLADCADSLAMWLLVGLLFAALYKKARPRVAAQR